jgi:hypothetical protein
MHLFEFNNNSKVGRCPTKSGKVGKFSKEIQVITRKPVKKAVPMKYWIWGNY